MVDEAVHDGVHDAVTGFVVEALLFGDASRAPGDEESLTACGVLDSAGVLDLVEFLESRFGIAVAESETVAENLDSVTNLCRYVSRKQAQGPARGATVRDVTARSGT